MESERAQNFNERLNQWISAQGFWFQLRYSMLGASGGGARAGQVIHMGARVLIFAAIVAVIGFIYLVTRTDGAGSRENIQASLISELGAKQGRLHGFQWTQNKLLMSSFSATGSEGTFFTELDVTNVSCKMGLLDGLAGKWSPGTVNITKLDIDLRAGAPDAKSAATLGKAVFKDRPDIDLEKIEVEDSTVSWGYSALTRGVIEGSRLSIVRSGDGWRLRFKGGTFSQNWLRGLKIEELTVLCRRDGVLFEKAIFKQGSGSVVLTGLTIKGTEQPVVDGILSIKHLALGGLLSAVTENFVEGEISGDFKVSGSVNSAEGIGFDGKMLLQGGDSVTLRDRLPLLRALSEVDIFNNYRRVTFNDGSFHLKTSGGNLLLSDVALKAEDLMSLKGDLSVRVPTQEELAKSAAGLPGDRSPIFNAETLSSETGSPSSSEFTLNRAGKETANKVAGEKVEDSTSRYTARREERKSEAAIIDRTAAALQYDGNFEITLRPDAFERSEAMRAESPVNADTGRVHLKVPVSGSLFGITLKQAEEIHRKSRR